jgi:protoheme IX farnesyltransferase
MSLAVPPVAAPAETPPRDLSVRAESVPVELTFLQRCAAIVELTKPGITRMVTITAAVGFVIAALGRNRLFGDLALPAIGCVLGTALSSSGANALNQWWERKRDARMKRTAARPLPDDRLTPPGAFLAGFTLCALGVLTLLVMCGPAPAAVSLVTIVWYLLFYTPLKPVTVLNTLIGAIPGALPPLIGWTATAPVFGLDSIGGLTVLKEAGGWCLFLLMVVWQIPHFLAIAWMYRDDYARGGHRMLPIVDPDGRATSTTILVWSITLVVVSLAPVLILSDRVSWVYGAVALISGAWFVSRCARLYRTRTRDHARSVFLASIMHLPLILIVMMADAIIGRLIA